MSSGTIPAARPGAEYAAGSAVYSIATLLTSGADHPDTLISRNNLAGAYRDAGDLGRAIPLFEQALAGCVRVLGADHPQALTSWNNLAGAYREAGDPAGAIPLLEQGRGEEAERLRRFGLNLDGSIALA